MCLASTFACRKGHGSTILRACKITQPWVPGKPFFSAIVKPVTNTRWREGGGSLNVLRMRITRCIHEWSFLLEYIRRKISFILYAGIYLQNQWSSVWCKESLQTDHTNFLRNDCLNSLFMAINAGSFAQGTSSESIGITSFRMELWKSFETLTIFTSIQDYAVAKKELCSQTAFLALM